MIFDPRRFLRKVGTRSVFRPDRDTALLHLGHPVFHRALAAFARTRFPGSGATRWTARRADVPEGADALLLVTVEEMAVNDLRETFHHWIRTVQFPIINGELGDPLPHVPARMLRPASPDRLPDAGTIRQAQEVWDDVAHSVRTWVDSDANSLSERLSEELARQLEQARGDEMERYQSRQGEVSKLIEQTTLDRLEREIASLRVESEQGLLFDAEERLHDIERSIEEKELEIRRRTAHYEELRQQLAKERDRIVQYVLPRRYALRGSAQVFPVAIEIRLPGGAQ